MGRLHRGDDARRREARNVGRIGDLEMLDPPAPVAAVFFRQLLINRNDLRVRGIADGMGRDLETVRCCGVRQRQNLRVRMKLQSARVRLVGIGLLEPRPARTERAIGKQFDPNRPETIAV